MLGLEDISHLLFTCPAAQGLWYALGLTDIIEQAVHLDRAGSAVLEYLVPDHNQAMPAIPSIKLTEVIVTSCWYLWWIRQRRVHNEDVPPLFKCKMSILSIVTNAAKPPRSTGSNDSRWIKLGPRQVKLNVDDSFFEDERAGGTVVVLRDYMGNFIAASCKYLPHVASSEMAEAIAMKGGLGLANSIGCNVVLAESDAMEVIQACDGEEAWWGESAAIYADCVDIAVTIGSVSYLHCMRKANKVTHSLARESFSRKILCNWVDELPDFILDELLNDVTEL
jgi:ribonuclease HI